MTTTVTVEACCDPSEKEVFVRLTGHPDQILQDGESAQVVVYDDLAITVYERTKGANRECDRMTFGMAIEELKAGRKVCRKGWNGKGMFLFLVQGSTFKVNRPPLLGIYPEGTEINYHAHIDMRTADGKIVPWLATQTDMLSEDWCIVE